MAGTGTLNFSAPPRAYKESILDPGRTEINRQARPQFAPPQKGRRI